MSRIGVLVDLREHGPWFEQLEAFGLKVCQLCSWKPELWTDSNASAIQKEAGARGIKITAFWAGWPGPRTWNFTEGPTTLGIVPAEHRAMRVQVLKQSGDFARKIGTSAVITHLGFIPENASDPEFAGVVQAVREIAVHLQQLGLQFWFETGQETPVTLLRLIETVGTGNLGLNLDPANLVLYGKANPVDALDVFGKYVRNLHVKDGLYPTDPMKLGAEVQVGQGKVNFPALLQRLTELHFAGEFIIEREIGGQQQKKDIVETIAYLQKLL